MEGIVLSNLDQIVKNPEVISEFETEDRWSFMDYDIEGMTGKCLIASPAATPKDVIFVPGLKGWHKVFVASWRLNCNFSLQLKLDTDPVFTLMSASNFPSPLLWNRYEWVEEHFWCCADLTGREITLRKRKNLDRPTALVWLRCVPMTDAEIAEYKEYVRPDRKRNMHLHFDNDSNHMFGADTMNDLLISLNAVKNTDAKFVTQEIGDDVYDADAYDRVRKLTPHLVKYVSESKKVAEKIDEVVKARADLIHSFGAKLYAGFRVSLASFTTPFSPLMQISFVKEHPEYYVKTRDGRTTPICSYAYPEVRQYAIDYVKRAVKRGYDGVSLIMHRGIHIAFEQPVLDEFARRYDGLDARRVPAADPRLHGLWCEYLSAFVRDLHAQMDAELGRHVPINIITDYDPDTALRVGVDVRTLAKEGLIDHICSDSMELFECLDGCMAEDGLIDLDKYAETLKKSYTVRRFHNQSMERIKVGAPKYLAIAEQTDVEFYGAMTPIRLTKPQEYFDWIDNLRALGIENFSFYNYCHSAWDRPIIESATRTAHDSVNPEYCTPNYYRVLSMDGVDISTYQPNWRG